MLCNWGAHNVLGAETEKDPGLSYYTPHEIIAPSLWYNYHLGGGGLCYQTTKLGGGGVGYKGGGYIFVTLEGSWLRYNGFESEPGCPCIERALSCSVQTLTL